MIRLYQLTRPFPLALVVIVAAGALWYATGILKAGGQEPGQDPPAPKQSTPPVSTPQSTQQDGLSASGSHSQSGNTKASIQLVQDAIELLRKTSIRSRIRQRGMLFDTELITTGTYIQADGGRGGTRIELVIETQNLKLDATMVNDGAYFFRQVISQDTSTSQVASQTNPQSEMPTVERINLRMIRNRFSQDKFWPGHWIAYGGLYLFMDQARRSFDFGAPEAKEINGISCNAIRGTWKPERLALLVPDQKDSILNQKTLNWKRIPQHIPLEVELYFLSQGDLKNFPYRIVFYRPTEELLEGIKKKPVLITEYSDPEIIETPAKSVFQFNADQNEVVDITEKFITSLTK